MKPRKLFVSILILVIITAVIYYGITHRIQRVSYRVNPDQNIVRIGVDIWTGFAPVHLGVRMGIFDRNGLKVNPIILRSTAERRAALFRGEIDAICATINELTIAWTQEARAVIVSGIDDSMGGDGIVAKKEITRIEDLKGKKVAREQGSPSHFFLIYLLTQYGLTEEDVEIVNMEAAHVGSAFLSGDLDAGVTWDPWLHNIADDPKQNAHILASTAEHPGVIIDVLAFRPQYIAGNPDGVERFMDAWFETIEYWKANPEESNKIMAEWMKQEVLEFTANLKGIRFSDLEHSKSLFGTEAEPGPLFDLIEHTSDVWLKFHKIESKVEPEHIINADFIRRAGTAP